MHDGEGGPRTPIFLVAGMFGNVSNLRHLAQLVGTDRPFYGLQARGLLGDAAPHESFPEAAADLIAELRVVQPHGPYLLGGFSGGGITAYEMAQQLADAGETGGAPGAARHPDAGVRPRPSARDRALIKWGQLQSKGAGYLGEWAKNRVAWELGRLRARFEEPAPPPEHAFHNDEIEAAFRAALPIYAMRPWAGPLTLFRPPLDRRWPVSAGAVGERRARVRRGGQRLDPLGAGDPGGRGPGRSRLHGARAERAGARRPAEGGGRRRRGGGGAPAARLDGGGGVAPPCPIPCPIPLPCLFPCRPRARRRC